MRPVDAQFPDSQQFGEGATAGVMANSDPNSGMGYYVYLYGNYQPFGHAGKDIACPIGTPVHAMAAGTILWAGWGEDLPGDDSWGPNGYFRRWALYKNFPGIVTVAQHWFGLGVYGHLSSNDAAPAGTQVTEGQIIGYSGNTKSRSETVAPHLHVAVITDAVNYSTGNGLIYGCTDPTPYFGGINPQGTVTPSEEDFMATLSDEEKTTLFNVLDKINTNTDAPELPKAQYWNDLINAVARVDASASAPELAAQINAAGLAAAVRDELVKLIGGTK